MCVWEGGWELVFGWQSLWGGLWLWSERTHGSTRVPGHAFLAWCSTMVVYIYFVTAVGNSEARNRAAPVRATGTVRKRQAVRPAHHVQNHTWRVTLLQPDRRAAVLGQPSSLRPHWLWLRECVTTVQYSIGTTIHCHKTFCDTWNIW
jgi:hypothetical protein